MIASGKFINGNKVNDNPQAALAHQSNQGGGSTSQVNADLYGMIPNSRPQVDEAVVTKCREDLRMLNIKASVMNEEANEANRKLLDTKAKVKTKQNSLNLLSTEKEDALERLRKV